MMTLKLIVIAQTANAFLSE